MKYSIILSPDAIESLQKLRANLRSLVREGIIEYHTCPKSVLKISSLRIKVAKSFTENGFFQGFYFGQHK
jgi:mRNA-degrading endonuclease RelE of RelBE toxin-antitoxin system